MFLRSLGYDPADVKSTQKFWKDVERGVLQSAEVIPKLGKAFDEAAEKNGAFAKASQTNSREMQRMSNAFQEFQDAIFKGGFAEGLNDTFKLFADILQNSKGLANVIGGGIGGAIEGIILPFRIVNALVKDFFKLFGIDGIDTKVLNITMRLVGLAAGIGILVKSLRALWWVSSKLGIPKLIKFLARKAAVPALGATGVAAVGAVTGVNPMAHMLGTNYLASLAKEAMMGKPSEGTNNTSNVNLNITTDETGLLKATAKATEDNNSDLASKINIRYSN